VRALWEKRGVRVEWQPPAESLLVPHDAHWVAEAVSNIVKNCIEHTPEGGTVTVRLESAAVLARIIVEDTGEGIAAEDIPRIFDRFFQPHQPPGAVSGTGVGLALARAIIERHHGVISVASEQGRGTRFTVTLHTREI
jgi:signal transduction histidine kinase